MQHVVRQQADIQRKDREALHVLLSLAQGVFGERKGGFLVERRVRFQELRDNFSSRTTRLFLQCLNFLQRHSLRRVVILGLAIGAHWDLVHVHFGLVAVALCVCISLAFGDEGFRMDFGSRDYAQTAAVAVAGRAQDLEGQVEGASDDLVGGEAAIFAEEY